MGVARSNHAHLPRMASRWRVWEGEAHVDSHGYSEKHTNVFVPVPHTLDWKDVQETLKNFVISDELKEKIKQSSHINDNGRYVP